MSKQQAVEFMETIVRARKRLGLTQEDVARRMSSDGNKEYTFSTICRLENGNRGIKLEEAFRLARIVGVNIFEAGGSASYSEGYRDGLHAARKALESL